MGHQVGAEKMRTVVEFLVDRHIKYLTLWGFSTNNWTRSQDEITDLFHLLSAWIETEATWLDTRGVRLHHIGRIAELPQYLRLAINQAVRLTQNNSGMTLTLAFNYSGQDEILDAVRRLIAEIPGGSSALTAGCSLDAVSAPYQLDKRRFSRYLDTAGMPDVDLVIRTAGEFRLSDFLIWQTAYSEYYFTKVLWPDFDCEELEKALQAYSQRVRRFGGD
jgi:undecaprenyl diphosphate synthase